MSPQLFQNVFKKPVRSRFGQKTDKSFLFHVPLNRANFFLLVSILDLVSYLILLSIFLSSYYWYSLPIQLFSFVLCETPSWFLYTFQTSPFLLLALFNHISMFVLLDHISFCLCFLTPCSCLCCLTIYFLDCAFWHHFHACAAWPYLSMLVLLGNISSCLCFLTPSPCLCCLTISLLVYAFWHNLHVCAAWSYLFFLVLFDPMFMLVLLGNIYPVLCKNIFILTSVSA